MDEILNIWDKCNPKSYTNISFFSIEREKIQIFRTEKSILLQSPE